MLCNIWYILLQVTYILSNQLFYFQIFYAKVLHHKFTRRIYENSKLVFYLTKENGNLEVCMPALFEGNKIWKSLILFWFHNYASEKNNSLNVHSNEPGINV